MIQIQNYLHGHLHQIANYFLYLIHFLCIILFVIKKWDFIKETISSVDTSPSQKRFIVWMTSTVIADLSIMSMLLNIKPDTTIWASLAGIVMFGIGAISYEKTNSKKEPAEDIKG